MTENSNIPSIRFADFTDPWEQRKLEDYLTLSRVVGHTGLNARKLTVKLWGKGVVEKTDSYGGSANTQYYVRHAGQFMYGKLDFLHAAFGIVPEQLDGYESTLDSPAFDMSGIDGLFLLNRVTQQDFYLRNGMIANGSRKAKRIHEDTFLDMSVLLPSLAEQQAIGNFFSHLDDLITLHQRKYDKLVVFKKAMLEQMFPQEGETVPKIRFAGFTDPWEQRKLGDIADLLTGFPFESKYFAKEGIPLIRGMNVKRGYLDMTSDICEHWRSAQGVEPYLLKIGDIVIQMDGALIGSSYAMLLPKNVPSLLVQRVARVRCDGQAEYVFQVLQRGFLPYIKGLKTETAVPHLSLSDIAEYVIPTPREQKEQQAIGSFFSRLDDLITLHQRKLELLQNIKKSLLDEMFV